MKKRIAVLGATGSIGKSALDVITKDTDRFEVVLLTAHSRKEELDKLINKFPCARRVLAQRRRDAENAEEEFKNLKSAIQDIKPDITINGISGAAGLEPSIAAIEAGSTLALANKETIVMAGEYVLNLAREKNVKIIPVDSEHSAIFHLLEAFSKKNNFSNNDSLLTAHCSLLTELILTASGGPFRNYTLKQMQTVTVKDALAHPTWNMGPKITIDSASMANKGLEVIEACYLFNTAPEKIKVAIHPQSIIHSMIRLTDGVVYAQLSKPDMRYPIADALYWPEISPQNIEPLSFDNLSLEFTKPDLQKFPMLSLAYDAVKKGGLYPCAYNAANEEAVSAFIANNCSFLDIPKITVHVLNKDWPLQYSSINTVLETDKKARLEAVNFIKNKIK